jgi:hypothetical protein
MGYKCYNFVKVFNTQVSQVAKIPHTSNRQLISFGIVMLRFFTMLQRIQGMIL